ncbi:MAG: protein kinase [Bdellovibrionales bacterium]|nr:protein kinase [Bdellovibrionales bacterium]
MQNFEQFGKYILMEKLATGGMAEVFLARAQGAGGINKFVAIKRILPQYADSQEFIDMFKGEAKIAVNLNHSNIVSIYDFGIQNNQLYLVMDYVEGRNLRQILNKIKKTNARLQIDQVVYVIKEVSAGLDHAHRCLDGTTGKPLNITHRDMSPQNVMISFEGEVKVVDFGIAKAESQIETTRAGTLKGKFGYMSPEQADGQAVDLRTDIFSLGIVIWELLANDRLFVASNEINTLRKIRDCQVPSLRKINPNIPNELERITMKALARDRNLRYQTAAAMHRDLNRFLNRQYPDFSSQDFATFIKNQFAEEIFNSRQRLVEYSNVVFKNQEGGVKKLASQNHFLENDVSLTNKDPSLSENQNQDTSSFVSETHPPNESTEKSIANSTVHSSVTSSLPSASISDIALPNLTGSRSIYKVGSGESNSSSIENSISGALDRIDKTEKYDLGSLEIPKGEASFTSSHGKPSAPGRLDERALSQEFRDQPIQGEGVEYLSPPQESSAFSSKVKNYSVQEKETASSILNQLLTFVSLLLFILSGYIFLAKYYSSSMEPMIRALQPYLKPIHMIAGIELENKVPENHGDKLPKLSPSVESVGKGTNFKIETVEKIAIPPVVNNPTKADVAPQPMNEGVTSLTDTILITSSPSGAEILIDNKSTGLITPSRVEIPTQRNFSVTLNRMGYIRYHRESLNSENLGNRLSATLQPALVGYVDIDVIPSQNVRVLINGRSLNGERLPISSYALPAETPVIIQALDVLTQETTQQVVKIPQGKKMQVLLDLRRSSQKRDRQPSGRR